MVEYGVYGIIEPYCKKIVYIDFYVYNWNKMREYPDDRTYVLDAVESMKFCGNQYWKDIITMWNSGNDLYDNDTEVVVFEYVEKMDEIEEKVKKYIDIFKPKYNVD